MNEPKPVHKPEPENEGVSLVRYGRTVDIFAQRVDELDALLNLHGVAEMANAKAEQARPASVASAGPKICLKPLVSRHIPRVRPPSTVTQVPVM